MRTVLLAELVTVARVLMALPEAERGPFLQRLLYRAHAAHQVSKRLGRPHPAWGDGSLSAAVAGLPRRREAFATDPDYLAALGLVIAALAGRARRKSGGRRAALGLSPGAPMCYSAVAKGDPAMPETKPRMSTIDPVWQRVCDEAVAAIQAEPLLGGLIHSSLLHHPSMERALAYRFSLKLASGEMSEQILREIADEAFSRDPDLGQMARADIMAVFERDPACHRFLQPILFFKGYQAVQAYRIGHWLWTQGRIDLAYFVQMRVSEVFGVDIHPAAKVGRGLMIDHAHSIVIGETAVVGDNVSMLHSVTLGGTGKEDGDRHPKIGNGVLIGAGAKVLGNIHVGHCSRIAAGSVVLHDVPPCSTVAGVPARVVGEAGCAQPSVTMDQLIADQA
ncbi:serine O-acetyltransferase [Cereibacter changlensis]|nr:serine O-acetyltransferase [Cereibacter changlensis]